MATPSLLPVRETRHRLGGISNTTFYELVRDGTITLVKIGARSFVEDSDIPKIIARLKGDSPKAA